MKKLMRMLALPAILLVAIGGLAACGSDDEDTTTNGAGATETAATGTAERPTTAEETTTPEVSVPTIVVRNAEPAGGVQELDYDSGDTVRFRVRSDVADHVHVHGYDLMKDVPAGGTVAFAFPADIQGVFEVELEDRAVQIAELRVNP